MQHKPLLHSPNVYTPSNSVFSAKNFGSTQHEANISDVSSKKPVDNGRSLLLSIPSETLSHITTFVGDPHSLFALSRVNRQLNCHVTDDTTWYKAFVFHFWGLGPEAEPSYDMKVMLRKSESTWKKEFLRRYETLRRWEKSRSSVLSYSPQYSTISSMHLLDNMSLLTSSIQYGIVGRSFPLTGKILKGYFDAAGTANGQGIGNPNLEFSPHVTALALSSTGGTGRLAWGFRSGRVATTLAPKIMESNRSTAKFICSCAVDEHRGDVRCIQFAGRDDECILSGCSHGLVKLWETKRMQCLWTGSGTRQDTPVPDPCVKLQYCRPANIVVAAFQSGDLILWWGFQLEEDGTGSKVLLSIPSSVRIPKPVAVANTLDTLQVDPNSTSSRVVLLLHYDSGVSSPSDLYFIRLVIDLPSGHITSTHFIDGPLGPITSLMPSFATKTIRSPTASVPLTPSVVGTSGLSISLAANLVLFQPSSFILAGDSLGRVSVWSWDVEGESGPIEGGVSSVDTPLYVRAMHKWDAHDSSVTAIEANEVIIVTGCAQGTLKVWDALTFTLLRTFAAPGSRSMPGVDPVNHIILRSDLLIAAVGSRVLVWQARPVTSDKRSKAKRMGKQKRRGTSAAVSKWQQQIELSHDIRESQRLLEDERKHLQHLNGRARAQQSALDELGLTEAEAVEYLIALSREEEQRRLSELETTRTSSSSITTDHCVEEGGVFAFDDVNESYPRCQPQVSSDPSSSSSGPLRVPQEESNEGAQMLSCSFSDISDAGMNTSLAAPASPSYSQSISPSPTPSPTPPASGFDGFETFPSITPSIASTPSRSMSSVRLAGSWSRGSPSIVGSTPSPPGSSGSLPSLTATHSTGASLRHMHGDEDDELRYVLELSLAEARSRGEDV